jgi:hypothetical protein
MTDEGKSMGRWKARITLENNNARVTVDVGSQTTRADAIAALRDAVSKLLSEGVL